MSEISKSVINSVVNCALQRNRLCSLDGMASVLAASVCGNVVGLPEPKLRSPARVLGYDLRSRIVHGQRVSDEDVDKALPLAEDALRRVWYWYFTHWYNENDNRNAIERIDEDLLG